MIKLIDIDNDFYGEPAFTVVGSPETLLTKKASHEAIASFVSSLSPTPGKMFVHILAMGAGEYYGANRNGDYFSEDQLRRYHETFVTSPAHLFRNHKNKDPNIAFGKIVFSVYNDRMHRIELIGELDIDKAPDIAQKIDAGDFPKTSMACKTPFDECSICGNQAHNRQEYCEHLRNDLGRIYPDGQKVMALNIAPLRFFDLSAVIVPADATSTILQKVASIDQSASVVGSAELAEQAGLVEKTSSLNKLSEFIKQLPGLVVDSYDSVIGQVSDPDIGIVPTLALFQLGDVLHTFAHLGISPSLSFLSELIGHKLAGETAAGIGPLVEGYLKEEGLADIPVTDKSFSGSFHSGVASVVSPFIKQASLLPMYVDHRLYIPSTNVGYVGNGPEIEPTPRERYLALSRAYPSEPQPQSLLKTLLTIGGMAIAAKWYITHEISKEMEKRQSSQNGIKIVLVKSANATTADFLITQKLAEAVMVKALT